jgi:hypothetical protein
MKKILISLLLAFSFIFISGDIFAATIDVTEKIPGANCVNSWDGIYTCNPWRWFSGVLWVVGAIIKYFTYIASLAAVLFIVINGILYSMAGINDGLKTGAKDRIVKTLIGLIILLLSGVILNMIAPWVYK